MNNIYQNINQNKMKQIKKIKNKLMKYLIIMINKLKF